MHPVIILLLVLLIGGALFLYNYASLAYSLKATKPLMAASHAYAQTPTPSTMRILVIGDSTAVGTGSTPEDSIAGRLAKDFPQAVIVNDSKIGEKFEGFLPRLQAHAAEHYDFILFQIGANDIVQMTPDKDIDTGLTKALALAHTMAPHTFVMCAGNVGLAPVFKWPLSYFYTLRSRAILALYKNRIAVYPEMRYVDLYNERKNEIFNTDLKKYYASDNFHPTGAGYGVWYEKLRRQIISTGLLQA